ncbi:restriction endonuclease subunit S [Microcystis wesenbergii]|uniref:Restriction endonuclease subunit S n=1 Tax=Microcystis wesenbergii NRERC-220 TaxID=3068991 RepID=A0ABU3HGP8_9CHRO|nr:restriction endonuclease subunit S [Microcystis wesenbergii]MDT3673710.1 restriction endonuclease subunit S [Microcystis wesenbergii NRERC-220]
MRTTTFRDVLLEEIAEIKSGVGFPISMQGCESGDFPFAKVGDISNRARSGEQFISDAPNWVKNEDLSTLKFTPFPTGTIVFAKIGEAIRQNFRAVSTRPMLFDNNVMGVIPQEERVDTTYLYFYLRTLDFYHLAGKTTVPAIRKSTIEKLKIPLPPLEEQRRIAAILDKADGVRRKRKEAIRLTEELLKSTFLEMFGDPVTNPKGWEICKIGKITDVKTGKTPSREDEENYGGDIRWVKTTEVRELIIKETEEFLTKKGASQVSIFPKNTILIAMYGQGATRGRTALLGLPCATNQACAAIMPSEKYAPFYLWTLLRLSYERLRELGRGGNQPNLNLSMVKNFLIPMPPLEKQIYFQNIVLNLQSQRQKMDLNLQYHDNLFNSLLQRAFRGEL